MTESEILFENLFKYFKVTTINELSSKIGVKPTTISSWRQRNSIKSIKKLCYDLDIYEDIFNEKNMQTIKNINGGQVAQNVHGNQTQTTSSTKEVTVDEATYNLFEEAYSKALDSNDLKGFRIHLMDY